MKFGSNRSINKDHKKLPSSVSSKGGRVAHKKIIIKKCTDKPVTERLATQDENLKMITEKLNDGKLAIPFLIVGAGFIAYHF